MGAIPAGVFVVGFLAVVGAIALAAVGVAMGCIVRSWWRARRRGFSL